MLLLFISLLFLSVAAGFDVFFINNTPRVRGGESGSVYAEIATTRPNSELICRLKGDYEDCKDFHFCLFPTAVNNHYKSYLRFRWYLQSY